MYRTKFTLVLFLMWLALPVQAQVTKSGSIFTDATQPRVPTSEEIKTDPPNANVTREITYCKVGSRDLRMDAYLPKNRGTNKSPALIYIHGGAWITGDKDEGPIEQDLGELLNRGYAVFSINYRLGPLNQFPAQIEDCKCAVRSLRANAARYGVDAKRIGVWGSSAGAHLAALLGTTSGIGRLEGYGGYPEESSTVQAVATYFAPADLTTSDWGFIDKLGFLAVFGTSKNWMRASPVAYINKGDAPFFVIGGDRDDRVDVRQAQLLHTKLQAASVSSELLVIKNCDHEFNPKGGALNPSRGEVTNRLIEFFDKNIRTATVAAAQEPTLSTTRRTVTSR